MIRFFYDRKEHAIRSMVFCKRHVEFCKRSCYACVRIDEWNVISLANRRTGSLESCFFLLFFFLRNTRVHCTYPWSPRWTNHRDVFSLVQNCTIREFYIDSSWCYAKVKLIIARRWTIFKIQAWSRDGLEWLVFTKLALIVSCGSWAEMKNEVSK